MLTSSLPAGKWRSTYTQQFAEKLVLFLLDSLLIPLSTKIGMWLSSVEHSVVILDTFLLVTPLKPSQPKEKVLRMFELPTRDYDGKQFNALKMPHM